MQPVTAALNEQFNAELYASNFYLQLSNFCEVYFYNGFAAYLKNQSNEEREHALKFRDYILKYQAAPVISEIKQPDFSIAEGGFNLGAAFEAALALEKAVTASINNIMKLAMANTDYATHDFLSWFVTEQLNSEAEMTEIIAKLKLIGNDVGALLEYDEEMGEIGSDIVKFNFGA